MLAQGQFQITSKEGSKEHSGSCSNYLFSVVHRLSLTRDSYRLPLRADFEATMNRELKYNHQFPLTTRINASLL